MELGLGQRLILRFGIRELIFGYSDTMVAHFEATMFRLRYRLVRLLLSAERAKAGYRGCHKFFEFLIGLEQMRLFSC